LDQGQPKGGVIVSLLGEHPPLPVEQNAFATLSIADRGYVTEVDKVTMLGKSEDLIADEGIGAAYLGI